MIELPASETLDHAPDTHGVPLREYISVIAAAFSPAVLVNIILLSISQLLTVRREFFGKQKYQSLSAPMTLDLPVRVVVFWFVLMLFGYLVFPLVTWPLVALLDAETIAEAGISMIVIGGKLTIEWSAFQARRVDEPDGVASWFSPEDGTV